MSTTHYDMSLSQTSLCPRSKSSSLFSSLSTSLDVSQPSRFKHRIIIANPFNHALHGPKTDRVFWLLELRVRIKATFLFAVENRTNQTFYRRHISTRINVV